MSLPLSHDRSGWREPGGWLLCFHLLLRTRAVKGIFVPRGPSSPLEVCAVLFMQKKDLVWLGQWENLSWFKFSLPLWHLQNSMLCHWKMAEINPQLLTANTVIQLYYFFFFFKWVFIGMQLPTWEGPKIIFPKRSFLVTFVTPEATVKLY